LPASSDLAVLAALCLGLSVAAFIDTASRRIPNGVCATIAAAGVAFAATGISRISLTSSLVGVTLGFVFMMPGYVFGSTGAGDVKLFASAGAVLGARQMVSAFLCVAIAGGALALVVAWKRGRLARTVKQTAWLCGDPATARAAIESTPEHNTFAYGPAIAVGCMTAALIPLL
jgi:prepilin peptidase CpaA